MNKLSIFICAILLAGLLSSCNPVVNQTSSGYDRSKIEEVIADHDTTILYFMTSWCQASQRDFESNMKPHLCKASDTKAIVVVCLGEVEQVSNLENVDKNVLVCIAPSRNSLLDKMFINKECKKLLSRYKRVNYVPVELACNCKGEILNWNTDEKLDRTYEFIEPYLMGWK